MATETTNAVIVLTRATYDNRKSEGTILNNVIYLVIEASVNEENFLSMYIGLNRVSDLISLDNVIDVENQEIDLNNIQIPAIFPVVGKIYTLIDNRDGENVFLRAYACLTDGTLAPLYGACIWEND